MYTIFKRPYSLAMCEFHGIGRTFRTQARSRICRIRIFMRWPNSAALLATRLWSEPPQPGTIK